MERRKFPPMIPDFPHLLHGADYNPDQWLPYDPDIISKDMDLLQKANMNSLTFGMFSWATLEPEEGKYDFSFTDRVMDALAEAGGKAVLSTPSAARPQWLAQKYPEVLRCAPDGRRYGFGRRANHCYTSPVYREKVRQINEQLALRYKDHPALGIWHISNEFWGECHCPLCKAAFRDWMQEKYRGDLDKLNYEHWTRFWSHTYTDWSQVQPPAVDTVGEDSSQGLWLDWQRFVSWQTTEFLKNEIEPIRAITPETPITTNLMEWFGQVDYRVLSQAIDIASWDDYPSWRNESESDTDTAMDRSMWHDAIRSLKDRPFLLMESTPSMVNWKTVDKLKRPGVHRLSSLLAVAHGSDSVQYFQFRKSRNGDEQHHGAVVDHVGHENTRVFREVSGLGADLKKLDAIVGTANHSDVAIVYEWENNWALEVAQYFNREDKKIRKTQVSHYKPFWTRGVNVDVIGYADDFSPYKLVILPMAYAMPQSLVKKIRDYTAAGGTVVTTYMAGMVNENNLTYLGGWPAEDLKQVFGVWNEEISCMFPEETNSVNYRGKEYTALDYCEIIHPQGAETLGTYREDYFAGMSAVTRNTYGKGEAYYIAFRDDGAFLEDFYGELLEKLGIETPFGKLPQGVTAAVRTDGARNYFFLHNFALEEKTVSNTLALQDLETGEELCGDIKMRGQTVRILVADC